MTCTETRRHWMLYLDSEGDAELHRQIRNHLDGCSVCATWFAAQERFEGAVAGQLANGEATPELWARILVQAGVRPSARRRWRPALALAGSLAAIVLAAAVLLRPGPELARSVAEVHARLLDGELRPEFVSSSDAAVDRYLKATAPFRAHCPPRSDVAFDVQGAGWCDLADRQRAAYIVGRVGAAPVSILVLDRASLAAFPHDRLHAGRPSHSRAGAYELVAGVVASNLVVVVGNAPPDTLEKLFLAYGTYPDD